MHLKEENFLTFLFNREPEFNNKQTCLALKCPNLLVCIMLCTSRHWNGSGRFAFDHTECWLLYNIRECLSTTHQMFYTSSQTARGGQIFP